LAILVGIDHRTRYRYDRAVTLSPHVLRLRPAPHARTPIHDYRLRVHPSGHQLHWQQDPFGNVVGRVVFPEPVTEFEIDVHLVAEMTVINPFDFFVESYAEHYPFAYDELLRKELEPYLEIRERGARLLRWLGDVDRGEQRIVEFLVDLNRRLQTDIGYNVRLEPGIQSCEFTLQHRIGSCRDTGWLLVQILRHLGLAARFASGYLVQLAPDVKSLDGPSGPEKDFTDLHAWAEVYVPGAGWVGLDPTSGLFAGEGHIPLACTPEPASAAPIEGFTGPCEVEFGHANEVRRLHEDPRVTKPYTEEQWASIRQLGRGVDDELARLDVRLTMGGEPTFVSIDDMDGAQWNTEALGADKRDLAGRLLQRLHQSFAPGGVLHYGQGKWYPGEPLPRWALGCYWRGNGEPLWRDARLIADENRSYGADHDTALRFALRLAQGLGIDSDVVQAGFENWLYYLWREAIQPPDLDRVTLPGAPGFRDDLSLALARGLDRPVGYVIPLEGGEDGTWHSARWTFDGGVMYLLPGGSPMGLRLPTGKLPWKVEVGGGRWEKLLHTALCVEPRAGRLYVFMPLLQEQAAYTALLEEVERTAAALDVPVLIEGYEPPAGRGLHVLKVTPDPGVIEVNIHPASTWDELEFNTQTLYEVARLSRLGTEKFMIDGRHTGTGGGNHVTLGGAVAEDSPFLRRPDLLRSLLTFWQHHPSLSYVFSGLFIGPTSQAPRVDEGAGELLQELAVSLDEVDSARGGHVVDRALRSFLCDLTGNTHRSEFCIDKLYSSDGASGRQGLVEFRAFEMPPHARMSLVQMLLLRILVAWFWKTPYRHALVPWGTTLHDQFMLPYYLQDDLSDVVSALNEAGYAMNAAWFDPFMEFRFPVYGRVHYEGVEMELRMALEPWMVLGEEVSAQRQARVVDSAVERLQIFCRGLDPQRFWVTCNGRGLPLHATGVDGEYVAGVRYKAWRAVFGLHPTAPVDAPLTFDLFDRQLGRSVGGCVYHVGHPGGRADETFPINAYAAESRRIARFVPYGHNPDVGPAVENVPNPAYPHTLDLRLRP